MVAASSNTDRIVRELKAVMDGKCEAFERRVRWCVVVERECGSDGEG